MTLGWQRTEYAVPGSPVRVFILLMSAKDHDGPKRLESRKPDVHNTAYITSSPLTT